MSNRTLISEVTLVGFPGAPEYLDSFISAIMFLVYIISLVANGSVLGLVIISAHLHQPMYLIIANLSASDLLFDTATLPKLIAKYWFGDAQMPFRACLFQMFCVHYFGTVDSFLLLLMAVDRYAAICHPLRYATLIDIRMIVLACGLCWAVLAPSTIVVITARISQMALCDRDKIGTLFCTHTAISALSCTDVSSLRVVAFTSALVVLLTCLALIVISYILIIREISSTHSENWQKAFYTCTTHLLVISLYYVPRVFVYIVTNIPLLKVQNEANVVLLCLYSFVPHLASPIIYFLRTKEIAETLRKVLRKKFRSFPAINIQVGTNHS
ncbi:PREDICTED: olfactory receptor 1M1-like [Nanorana parkeri]|uniref:olfactory receptor 1M1-like n=1 Tax=Nanorana parkeri TaxID=125878 RepID=UPI00085449CA|nr:PREDICTED: olfactory receptor 1M1-like [Nanorana parkeri]